MSDRKSGVPFGGIQHLSMDLKEELRLDFNFVKVNKAVMNMPTS